jgi:hypothetical protein
VPKLRLVVALGAVLLLAACGGRTTGAFNVDHDSASLGYEGHCDTDDEGWIFVEYREVGTTPWTRVDEGRVLPQGAELPGYDPNETTPCTQRLPSSGEVPGEAPATGLDPSTTYEYRVGFRFVNGYEVVNDSTAPVSGSNTAYHTFTTDAAPPSVVCDDSQAVGESVTDFIADNPAGTAANKQDLCLRDGSYSLGGAYTGLKPHQFLKAGPDTSGDGTRAEVSITGEFMVDATGVVLESLKLIRGTNHMVITVTGEDVTLRHLDVDGLDAANVPLYSGLQIGNSSGNRASNTHVVSTFFHDIGDIQNRIVPPGGPDDRGHDHAIYCVNGDGAVVEGSWFTSNADGYSFHWYPDCDNSHVFSNVVQDTSHGMVLANDSSGNLVEKNLFTNVEGWFRPDRRAVGCSGLTGTGNVVRDYVDQPASGEDCSAGVTLSGERNTAPTYVNAGARDFRLTAGSLHRDLLGSYSDVKAGVLP